MEQTEEPLSNEINPDQRTFPTRYFWVAPFVMATYLCYGVNSDFIVMEGTATSSKVVNCVVHALVRTMIATYFACIVRVLMELGQQKFGLGPEWTPYIRTLDVAFYAVHAFVPSEKLMAMFYGTGQATTKQPKAMIIVALGLLMVTAVLKLLLCLLRNPRLLQEMYENVTTSEKPAVGENVGVHRRSR